MRRADPSISSGTRSTTVLPRLWGQSRCNLKSALRLVTDCNFARSGRMSQIGMELQSLASEEDDVAGAKENKDSPAKEEAAAAAKKYEEEAAAAAKKYEEEAAAAAKKLEKEAAVKEEEEAAAAKKEKEAAELEELRKRLDDEYEEYRLKMDLCNGA